LARQKGRTHKRKKGLSREEKRRIKNNNNGMRKEGEMLVEPSFCAYLLKSDQKPHSGRKGGEEKAVNDSGGNRIPGGESKEALLEGER